MSIQRNLTPLNSSSRYAIRVRAWSNLGIPSDWSEALEIKTGGDSTVPSAPVDLAINYTSSTLILSWTNPTTNNDGTPLLDLAHMEITLTANSTSVVYTTPGHTFSYSYDQNAKDFTTVQSVIDISIKAVDIDGNHSIALTGTATNGLPSSPINPPVLAAAFSIITITMTSGQNADWGGYYLEYSTDGVNFSALATLINEDTYNHAVSFEITYWYRYKIRDKFGNLSASFSPVANITTHRVLQIDGFTIIDNLYIASNLIVGNPNNNHGQIQSFNYATNAGYLLTYNTALFQNGSITVIGASGSVTLDSTSLRAVYSGTTELQVDSTGVYIGGNDPISAEIYVDTTNQITHIQGNTLFASSGGNYTFSINLSNQTTGDKVLRLYDSFGNDTFYLTNDGEGWFAKGNIQLGGSSALNIDNGGNIWLGNSSFASAPFSVTAGGALKATSATVSGTINASAGTFTNTVTVNGTLSVGGNVQSNNWNGSTVGWIISPGTVTFNGAAISGSSISGSTISGGSITGGTITGGTIQTAAPNNQRVSISGGATNIISFYGIGNDYAAGTVKVTYNSGTGESTMYVSSPQAVSTDGHSQMYCIAQPSGGSVALLEANDIRLRNVGPSYANNLIVDANALQFNGDPTGGHSPYSKLQGDMGIGVDNSGIGYRGSYGTPANGTQFVDGPLLYGNSAVMLGGNPAWGGLLRVIGDGAEFRCDIFVDNYVFGNQTVSGTKSFEINHPILGEDYFLRFSTIEGPRAELIYRGKANLVNGTINVDIDECYGMEHGTFDSLNIKDTRQVFLYNETGDSSPRYKLNKGILNITCEDLDAIIGWMVIGERGDKQMIEQHVTNEFGRPIIQGIKSDRQREASLSYVGPNEG